MAKFNFKEWENKKVVMHCKTREEANEFCELMHKEGKTWIDKLLQEASE